MSKTSKIVWWVIVLVVVIVGVAWFAMSRNSTPPAGQAPSAATSQSQSGAATGLSTTPTDSSNAALNQDLTSIDAELNGLASDSASIDQGLNDQPVSQGQ